MKKKKVLVAMSGGVDSSVAAALLKNDGYDVIGATMQVWPREAPDSERSCCSLSAVEDARKVTRKLNIPHYVLNFRNIFEEKVIGDFVSEYHSGRTPNPCIRCNEHIKFDALIKKADGLGIEMIATGHYARIEQRGSKFSLLKGIDPQKDQSYMLYVMNQASLGRTLFPNGDKTKKEIRKIARSFDLPVAEKAESQEICFVPEDNYGSFIEEFTNNETKPGPILDSRGNVLGTHKGIIHYTIGQRKGLGIPRPEPLYVIKIDPERNAIIVGGKNETLGTALEANGVHFISGKVPDGELEVTAKIRYNSKESKATVCPFNDSWARVRFSKPQNAITPGQSVVFYNGETVIGGGIINSKL